MLGDLARKRTEAALEAPRDIAHRQRGGENSAPPRWRRRRSSRRPTSGRKPRAPRRAWAGRAAR
eukprot:4905946-Prymnesium_polylepis.1